MSSKAGDESAKVYLIISHNKFGYAYLNLCQVPRRVSCNKFAGTGSRDLARALVRTLRVFKEWDPEHLCKVL
jgi:hypothetical protein